MIDREGLQRWLDRYVLAWRANEADPIRELFTEDATYRYHPLDERPVRGVEAIVDAWLEDRDEPDAWHAEYRALAVDGDIGVAEGWTRYAAEPDRGKGERLYANLFVMRFDESGRCRDFTEWYMEPRKTAGDGDSAAA
jgi:hypothetical protein